MAKKFDVKFEVHMPPQAKKKVALANQQALAEVFELDIKPEAVERSPWLTGNNRRSIATEVVATRRGAFARIFSQSGYGGYLELGTSRMHARPYIYPAVRKFVAKIARVMGVKMSDQFKDKLKGRTRTQ